MEKKNKVGRPTTFMPEYLEIAKEHFSKRLYEEYEEEVVVAGVGIQTLVKQRAAPFPSMSGLAMKLGVNRQQIYEWEKIHPEFSDILNHGREVIREFLMSHGVTGKYNSNFAKFVATNLTDLTDKKEVSNTNKNIEINIDEQDRDL